MTDLVRHPVHRALTRPQMFAGVTMNFFILNLLVTAEAFLILKSFWIIPIPIILHVIGYFACLREPSPRSVSFVPVVRTLHSLECPDWRSGCGAAR